MTFDNSSVHRQDRLLSEERAIEIIREGEYCIMSMVEDRNGSVAGYGLPLSYVFDGVDSIYIHCAPQGHKLECLDSHPEASICIVGKTKVEPSKFTTNYESIVARGKVARNLSHEEKMHGLELFLAKYCPNDKVIGMKYAEKSFHRTEILKFTIDTFSAKAKVVK